MRNSISITLFCLLAFYFPARLAAQKSIASVVRPTIGQPVFEDGDGESSIFFPSGGTVKFNTKESSLKISAAFQRPVGKTLPAVPGQIGVLSLKKPVMLSFGGDIKGKTVEGIAPLISKGKFVPGYAISGYFGVTQITFRKARTIIDHYAANPNSTKSYAVLNVFLKLGYEGSTFKYYTPDSVFANQINTYTFNTLVANLKANLFLGGNKVLGVSVGYKKENNYGDMDELKLTDTYQQFDSATNTTRSFSSNQTVKTGTFVESHNIPLRVDFFWAPTINNINRVGFYHYWKSTFSTDKTSKHGFGTGIYYLSPKSPFDAQIGLVFDVNDVSKLKEGYGKGYSVNFVVGYNFGFI